MTENGAGVAGINGMINPQECAESTVEGLSKDTFLITPHEGVRKYIKNKAEDYDQWILGMQNLQDHFKDWVNKIEEMDYQ